MTLGVVMLVHDALERATQLARHWAQNDCPVVIHVDHRVVSSDFTAFKKSLADLSNIKFCDRRQCDWGRWSLVESSQIASKLLLQSFSDVTHVLLASGSCLPLRPIPEMVSYLDKYSDTDFIESVTTQDVPWTIGGLDIERFIFRFPFSWKRHRVLFDAYVKIQRRLGLKRKIPLKIVPHLGSQWWCLTRNTLNAILNDPNRAVYDKYFKHVWIPDESYYQTLVRNHSAKIESRSLTLSKFDFQGKPYIFYDDHLQLLRRSDCFVARKAWRHADKLYSNFLSNQPSFDNIDEPNPGKVDRIFTKSIERRTAGRPGLYMHSCYPREGRENSRSASRYVVLEGFSEIYHEFEAWLGKQVDARIHGHLFGKDKAHFANNDPMIFGALTDNAKLRDYNPRSFLTNFLWNTQGERQCFQYGPGDNQDISWEIAKDPNARIYVVSGAWAIPLFLSSKDFGSIRREAAQLQQIENAHLTALRSSHSRARIHIWSLSEFVLDPYGPLQTVVDDMGGRSSAPLTELPAMQPLDGFGQFLQDLKNQGMLPYLMGEFPAHEELAQKTQHKPYLVS